MKPSDIVDRVLTDLWTEPSRWTQGDFGEEDGSKTCMLGALGYAAVGNIWACVSSCIGDDPEIRLSMHIARRHIESMIDTPYESSDQWSAIPLFNDGCTFDEARGLLEKARAQLQEMGE